MAHFYRLVFILLAIAYSPFAMAVVCGTKYTQEFKMSLSFDTAEKACASAMESRAPWGEGEYTIKYLGVGESGGLPACLIQRFKEGKFDQNLNVRLYIEEVGPPDGGTCQGPVGGGMGEAAEFCKGMGEVKAKWRMVGVTTGSAPSSACYMPQPPFEGSGANSGCATSIGDSVSVPNPDGTRSWSATGVATGQLCTDAPAAATGNPSQNPPPRAAENPCPSGFPGTVNGTSVCVPSVPDSGVGGTTKKEVTNADGSKEITDTSTECNGGVCTTTTTKKNVDSAGNQVGSSSTTTTKESITAKCAATPGDKVCIAVGLGGSNSTGGGRGNDEDGPSSFGGDCAAGFKAVSDDAVINAMAEETFRQNCKVNPDAMSQLKGQQANAADPSESIKKDNGAFYEREITSDMIQQTDYIGMGEQCMPDKSISIHGQSFLIPFSNICDPMRYIGLIAVAASLVLAYRIIGSNK